MGERVLIIDDDVRLSGMLQTYLGGRGLAVQTRPNISTGRAALASGGFDVLVLDVMLPDGDGMDLCRQLRAEGLALPIVMLTARGEETDRILGLELGADDYLPKPFNPRELLARLKAVLRRSLRDAPSASVLRFGELEIDRGARRVQVGGEARRLTSHQYNLLVTLAERAGRVLSREQLMVMVRGEELTPYDRSIDVHISRIRAAIEPDPRRPRRILTVRGAGYVFVAG